MTKEKLKTATIGIPAHNEEANIKNLLDFILEQKQYSFKLEKIIVMCDGCTDGTEKIVKEFARTNQMINLFSDGKRIGKALRLNQIYEMNESDYLITLDADIEPEDEFVFEKLLKPFYDPQVAVIAGNGGPLPGRTLVEKLVVAKYAWWYEARKNFKDGNNIYNSVGCCFALRKSFVQSFLFLPRTVHDEEIIYLEVKRQNKLFVFADEARLFYREASTWSELISRMRRFEMQDNLEPYGFEVDIEAEYELKFANKILGLWKVTYQNPFYGIGSLFLAVALKFVPRRDFKFSGNNPALWEMTASTKKLHNETAHNARDYSCEVVRDLDEKYKNEWRFLWEKSKERHFFNSPEFFQACCEAFRIEAYIIIFCYRRDVLCGVLPLTEKNVFGIATLIAPGNAGNYIDKSPLLVDEYSENLINAILFSALKLGHLYLAELSESAKSLIEPEMFVSSSVLASYSPRVFLSDKTDTLEYMPKNQKSTLNRRLSQQKEIISFKVEGAESLEKVISVERGSYRPYYNMAFFTNEDSMRFLMAIAKLIPDGLYVGILYLENKPVATVTGFINGKTFYSYHIAFLEQYRGIGPGKMALYLTLEQLKKEGFTEIDLLRGYSDIKRQFSNEVKIQYDVYLSKNRLIMIWWKFNLMIWRKLKQINSQLLRIRLSIKKYKQSSSLNRLKTNEAV
ncbi:MAG: hypothetical protein HW401_397 [Parcubacteria group bacterium]|nr:hypothetical protein [Parcubacteria group bacterium]